MKLFSFYWGSVFLEAWRVINVIPVKVYRKDRDTCIELTYRLYVYLGLWHWLVCAYLQQRMDEMTIYLLRDRVRLSKWKIRAPNRFKRLKYKFNLCGWRGLNLIITKASGLRGLTCGQHELISVALLNPPPPLPLQPKTHTVSTLTEGTLLCLNTL